MERRKQLDEIFKDIDPKQKQLVEPLLDEIVALEKDLEYFRSLPKIMVYKDNPAIQKKTEAAKLRKEASQSYMNAIRILCSLLNKVDGAEEDPVAKFLEGLNG